MRISCRVFLLAILGSIGLPTAPRALAQTSPNAGNSEHVFNSGGNPAPAVGSASFTITLGSIGDGMSAAGMNSPGYRVDGGFGVAYPPPSEVLNLRFVDPTTLTWDPERSVGSYSVYRGLLSDLSSGYGSCFAEGLMTTQGSDAGIPAAGQGFFYLVTAENRIAEEGTLGDDSAGDPRPNTAPCP